MLRKVLIHILNGDVLTRFTSVCYILAFMRMSIAMTKYLTLVDLRAPHAPKFSQFHAVFMKIWQNRMLAPPPSGNPGFAPDADNLHFYFLVEKIILVFLL